MSVAPAVRWLSTLCFSPLLAQHTWVPLNALGHGGLAVADSPLSPMLMRPQEVLPAYRVKGLVAGALRYRVDPLPAAMGQAQAAVFDSGRHRVVAYSSTGDVCTFDGARWTVLPTPVRPAPRVNPSLAYDPIRDEVVLFGGAGPGAFGAPLGDTWLLRGDVWTQVFPFPAPAQRQGARLAPAVVQGNVELLLFGGNGSHFANPGGTLFDDTWAWNGTTWVDRAPNQRPAAREAAAMAFDPQSGQTLLYGGVGFPFQGPFHDAWAWSGTDWVPMSSPAAIDEPLLVRDGSRLLLLGRVAADRTTVAYAWQGGAWSLAYQEPPLPQVFGESAAFDTVRGEVVRFGGREYYGGVLRSDTWAWNGSWSARSTAVAPPARQWAAMAFDAVRQEVVLFGGADDGGVLADTWTWDGTAWTPHTPAVAPSPRGQASAAWHPGRSTVVLFGGSSTSYLTDTWEWNGASWLPVATATTPPAVRGTLAFDAARSVLALHSSVWPAGDLWELQAGGWTQVSTTAPYGGVLSYDPATAGLVVLSGTGADYVAGTWQPRSQAQPAQPVVDPQRGGILDVGPEVRQSTPVPATAVAYGTGCGALGEVTCGFDRRPAFDTPFTVQVRSFAASTPAFLVFGLSQVAVPLGGSGCSVYLDAPLGNVVVLTEPSGWANFNLQIPAVPGTTGLDVFTQAVIWYGGPFELSNGVAMRLGI